MVSVDAKKQMLDLTLLPPTLGGAHIVPAAAVASAAAAGNAAAVASVLPVGSLAMGRLSRVQVRVFVGFASMGFQGHKLTGMRSRCFWT